MKNLLNLKHLATIITILFIGCLSLQSAAQNGVDVKYLNENRFFVHQNAKKGTLKLVIKSEKELDGLFGISFIGPMAPIDFNRYFMIVVVVPHEIAQATIKPMSLKRNGNKLVFSYAIDMNDRTDTFNRSYVALLVDRTEPTKVEFQEVSTSGEKLQSLPKNVKALQDQLKYYKAENELLKRQVAELRADKEALQIKLWKLNDEIKALQNEKGKN